MVVAKSSGLEFLRVDQWTYTIQVERRLLDSIVLWPFMLCTAGCAVAFAGLALAPLLSGSTDFGSGIFLFVTLGAIAYLSGITAFLLYREARRYWYDRILEIDLQQHVVTLRQGPRFRRMYPLSEITAIGLGFYGTLYPVPILLYFTMHRRRQELRIQDRKIARYRQSEKLAEIAVVGNAIADALQVPFKAEAPPFWFGVSSA